jgi:hypothetical protein
MKAFKQRAWLYVVVGVVVVFFFIVAPRLGEQATEIGTGELAQLDAEEVACEVCGERAVIFRFDAEKPRGWCALHVPPEQAACMICGAEGAPLWKRKDGRVLPFCEDHLPEGEQWERITPLRQERPATAPDAAHSQAGD